MKNFELINRLKKLPLDYEIKMGNEGYDSVGIEIDHDYECIMIDGYFQQYPKK